MKAQPKSTRDYPWISQGVEALFNKLDKHAETFDVVIAGSGYGGAVAASELAGCTKSIAQGNTQKQIPISVCVLERGNEYLQGMFPACAAELPGHVRLITPDANAPKGKRDALFDIRIGNDVSTVLANGLGGGSLINAGVMEEPRLADITAENWPSELSTHPEQLKDYFKEAKSVLGAVHNEKPNTVECADNLPEKFIALKQLSQKDPGRFKAAAITLAMQDKKNSEHVFLNKCIQCGDCVTGCNHGAKESLDVNLLHKAHRKGAHIYTGATILKLERDNTEDVWILHVTYTKNTLAKRLNLTVKIKSRHVILSAGSLGTTEILLRSADDALKFSPLLGKRFSTNGDAIACAYDQSLQVNAVSDEEVKPDARKIGPTITGIIDKREDASCLIEEMAVPGALRHVFEEIVTTTDTFAHISKVDWRTHKHGVVHNDPYAINPAKIGKTSVIALMGNDGANGVIELHESANLQCDGAVRIRWPELARSQLFSDQISTLESLMKNAGTGGRVVTNPLWRLLPGSLNYLLKDQNSTVLTVHPLGGCAMGDNVSTGVVDQYGRVFNNKSGKSLYTYHPGLAVLDGAIIPTALSVNPALTITALCLRAVRFLRTQWNYSVAEQKTPTTIPRPIFRRVENARQKVPTEIQLVERMSNTKEISLKNKNGDPVACIIELTLYSDSKPLRAISHLDEQGNLDNVLTFSPPESAQTPAGKLRIFDAEDWKSLTKIISPKEAHEQKLDTHTLLIADITGELSLFNRNPSFWITRCFRAGFAWFLNRGLRDIWQELFPKDYEKNSEQEQSSRWKFLNPVYLWKRFVDIVALTSHAGEIRTLEYSLSMQNIRHHQSKIPLALKQDDISIFGIKTFTYSRCANPWNQLQDMKLVRFPFVPADVMRRKTRPMLSLDTHFLARERVALLELTRQNDQVTALTDLGGFVAYIMRNMFAIHLWSFRAPDKPVPREPQRLPGTISGLPKPVIHEIQVDTVKQTIVPEIPEGTPVKVRLTRYSNYNSNKPPLVMIHGYSASGTTFAHHAVNPNLASYFHQKRDIWILDLRTSSGMPTARHPWAFEEAAMTDIPVAFDYIYRHTGRQKMDVLAHCMGSVMFSMAVLGCENGGHTDEYDDIRKALPDRVNSVILSQVGPVVVLSPINIFRGYVASYLYRFFAMPDYAFRPSVNDSFMVKLFDRVLSTLPYPKEEFRIENPAWPPNKRTPFTGTRHRMDALYGRDFSLTNIDSHVLDYIDDFFGPLSVQTVTQVIHFAKWFTITDRNGHNRYVSRKKLQRHWRFPTMSIHGKDNGLSDVKTLHRMEQIFLDAEIEFEVKPIEHHGHQDCLIGKHAAQKVYPVMSEFFEKHAHRSVDISVNATLTNQQLNVKDSASNSYLAMPPWMGPVVSQWSKSDTGNFELHLKIWGSPDLEPPLAYWLVPVMQKETYFELHPDWLKTSITGVPRFTKNNGALLTIPKNKWPSAADGLLTILVYNENADLHTQFFHFNISRETSSEQAIKALLAGRSAEQLQTAFIQSPPPDSYIHTQRSAQNLTLKKYTRFALSSCQFPPGFMDKRLAYQSYQRLSDWLKSDNAAKPGFLMLVGDQVYVDSTSGLFDPTVEHDRYVRPYQNWLSDYTVKSVLSKLPTYMMLDDHELENNWEPMADDEHNEQVKKLGVKSYREFQQSVGAGTQTPDERLWFQLVENGIPFFIMNTRTERTMRNFHNIEQQQIMKESQWKALTAMLTDEKYKDVPKFIASPAIVLPRHKPVSRYKHVTAALHSDAWDGYPLSFRKLLAFIVDEQVENAVFLSGDEHLSCIAKAELQNSQGNQTTFYSIHSSALYAPFLFANARPEDLEQNESFEFQSQHLSNNASYTCDVSTEIIVPGDGFALIEIFQDDNSGSWNIHCEFNRSPDARLGNPRFELCLEKAAPEVVP